MLQRWVRVAAPVTAVLYVALMVVAVALSGSTPDSNARPLRVISFYVKHGTDQRASDILFVLAALFLVFFAGILRGYLRRSREAETASALVLSGGVLLAVGLSVLSGIDYALADVPRQLTPAAAQALNILGNDVFYTLPVGGCVFGISAAVAILRGRTLPSWLGWVMIVIGIALATPALWIAAIALLIWSLVVGGLLFARPAEVAVA